MTMPGKPTFEDFKDLRFCKVKSFLKKSFNLKFISLREIVPFAICGLSREQEICAVSGDDISY